MPVADAMEITDIPVEGYERVVRAKDPDSGLHAFISVHDSTLGPAMGGLRMWPYESEQDALFDVNRLAMGMSYKSAVAHTGVGGGKAVIIGDPKTSKSEALYLAMGRFIDSLGGLYYTAEDVNTTVADLEIVRRATKYITGLSVESGGSGNPSPYTAYGVYLGIRAAFDWLDGNDSVEGKTVAIQGVGAVGAPLAERLIKNGAKVYGADRVQDKVDELADRIGLVPVSDDELYGLDVDVFAPCALGAIINDESIPQFRCKIVAGAANNVLLEARHGAVLEDRGILYAPDYVINAGGIVNVAAELDEGGYDQKVVLQRIERIPQALREVWTLAKEHGLHASEAADQLAQNIIAEGKK